MRFVLAAIAFTMFAPSLRAAPPAPLATATSAELAALQCLPAPPAAMDQCKPAGALCDRGTECCSGMCCTPADHTKPDICMTVQGPQNPCH